jgi:hypothetical protein
MRWISRAVLGVLALAVPAVAQSPSPSPSGPPRPLGKPCQDAPENRALDFWIGEWDVRPQGAPAGRPPSRSRIERVEDGCVIAEFYTTPQGYSGRSQLIEQSEDEGKTYQTSYDLVYTRR